MASVWRLSCPAVQERPLQRCHRASRGLALPPSLRRVGSAQRYWRSSSLIAHLVKTSLWPILRIHWRAASHPLSLHIFEKPIKKNSGDPHKPYVLLPWKQLMGRAIYKSDAQKTGKKRKESTSSAPPLLCHCLEGGGKACEGSDSSFLKGNGEKGAGEGLGKWHFPSPRGLLPNTLGWAASHGQLAGLEAPPKKQQQLDVNAALEWKEPERGTGPKGNKLYRGQHPELDTGGQPGENLGLYE